MMRLLIAALACLSLPGHAALETFAAATWENHAEIANPVLTDDLVISVPVGAGIKGVSEPNAIYPGFDPERPASMVSIEPRNTLYLDVHALGATDLFQMSEPRLVATGYRDGEVVASAEVGPFWNDDHNSGTVAMLSGFTGIDRLELRSVGEPGNSDVHLFIDSIVYDATNSLPSRPVIVPDDDDDDPVLGAIALWWLTLLTVRRRLR